VKRILALFLAFAFSSCSFLLPHPVVKPGAKVAVKTVDGKIKMGWVESVSQKGFVLSRPDKMPTPSDINNNIWVFWIQSAYSPTFIPWGSVVSVESVKFPSDK